MPPRHCVVWSASHWWNHVGRVAWGFKQVWVPVLSMLSDLEQIKAPKCSFLFFKWEWNTQWQGFWELGLICRELYRSICFLQCHASSCLLCLVLQPLEVSLELPVSSWWTDTEIQERSYRLSAVTSKRTCTTGPYPVFLPVHWFHSKWWRNQTPDAAVTDIIQHL